MCRSIPQAPVQSLFTTLFLPFSRNSPSTTSLQPSTMPFYLLNGSHKKETLLLIPVKRQIYLLIRKICIRTHIITAIKITGISLTCRTNKLLTRLSSTSRTFSKTTLLTCLNNRPNQTSRTISNTNSSSRTKILNTHAGLIYKQIMTKNSKQLGG